MRLTASRKSARSGVRRLVEAVIFGTVAASVMAVPAAPAAAAEEPYRFVAKVEFGAPGAGGQSCSGALVAARWVLTAKSCFAADGQSPAEGRPAKVSRVRLGDLSRPDSGYTVSVVKVVPHPDRDVALARLAVPVTDVAPVALATAGPSAGEVLRVAGYGRTATSWVPDLPHAATFTVQAGGGAVTSLAGTAADQVGPCQGDAGGPSLRESGGSVGLVAITRVASGQGGCLGASATAARGGSQTRVDDLAPWFEQKLADRTVNILIDDLSELCLAIPGASTAPGAHAIQWTCNGAAEQDWRIAARSNGRFEIRNDHSEMCLGIEGESIADKAHILQWNCRDANPDQYWQLTEDANGFTELRNAHSGKCLAILDGSTADGAHMIQWPCKDTNVDQNWKIQARVVGERVTNQRSQLCLSNGGLTGNGAHAVQAACDDANDAEWHLRARYNGYAELRNDRSGQCLGIESESRADGAHALQWPCRDANPDQNWLVETDANGQTRLRNAHSGKCLAILNDSPAPGAHLLQWTCRDANTDQFWLIGDAVPAAPPVAATPLTGSLVETYAYPDAARILQTQNVRLLAGDGHIQLADCNNPPDSDITFIYVYTTDLQVNGGESLCFRVSGTPGLLTMEVPAVFEIRGDGRTPGSGDGHDITAVVKPQGGTATTIEVDSDGSTGVGAGTDPPGPPTTLLQLTVAG